jgi:hypothetical protein
MLLDLLGTSSVCTDRASTVLLLLHSDPGILDHTLSSGLNKILPSEGNAEVGSEEVDFIGETVANTSMVALEVGFEGRKGGSLAMASKGRDASVDNSIHSVEEGSCLDLSRETFRESEESRDIGGSRG